MKFYQGQIHCKLAAALDNFKIKIYTTEPTTDTDNTEVKVVLYRSKHVELSAPQDNENVDQSSISHSYSAYSTSIENLEMNSKKVSSFNPKPSGQSSMLTDDIDGASKQHVSGDEVCVTVLSKHRIFYPSTMGGLIWFIL